MSLRVMKLTAMFFVAGLLVVTSLYAFQKEAVQPQPTPPSELPGAELIAGYKKWTRVNRDPAFLRAPRAIDCAAPLGARKSMIVGNPHLDKFIVVYVNDIGKDAMMKQKKPHFPVGAIIVKEKLPEQNSETPELLTVMIKRDSGFNPESGDWEYMAVDGSGQTVQARGRLETCQACHAMVSDTDYVSRSYISNELTRQLK